LTVALLSVGGASGEAAAPMNVPCAGQAALVAAITAANSAGGGTLNLAKHCDYALTSVDNSGVNGLPVITTAITVNGHDSTIDGTGVVRVFEIDGPATVRSTGTWPRPAPAGKARLSPPAASPTAAKW
jgi:hypothetical protein